MRAGLLHIYHGGGKGKTTAAAGLCLRAAGHGLRVGFAQFLKDGSSGECAALKVLPGVTVFDALPHVPFTFSMTPEEREEARDFYASLLRACESAASGLDLLVLDEVLDAVLPRYVRSRLHEWLLEAASSEVACRQNAMHTATENARDLINDLTRKLNASRQASITQELTEIIGSADALNKKEE